VPTLWRAYLLMSIPRHKEYAALLAWDGTQNSTVSEDPLGDRHALAFASAFVTFAYNRPSGV
jgi:hypothetical protein